MFSKIFFFIFFSCLISQYSLAQEPYNFKIYEFEASRNQLQTLLKITDSLYAFQGSSAHNHSDSTSIFGILDHKLDLICLQRQIDKAVIFAQILPVTQDSFLIVFEDIHTKNAEIYSFNLECELQLLKEIPFNSYGDFDRLAGMFNFHYEPTQGYYYLVLSSLIELGFAKTVVIQMNTDLSINWIHSLDTLFRDTAIVPSHRLFFKEDTILLHQFFVQDYVSQEDKLQQLMVSKIDRNTGALLDYCVNLDAHMSYSAVNHFKVLQHQSLQDHYYVTHGIDTNIPFWGQPEIEQMYYKPALALYKGCEMIWNKPFTQSDWGFNRGHGNLLYSHDKQNILIPSYDFDSFDKPYGMLSMLDLEGNEIWTRKYNYQIDAFEVQYVLYGFEYDLDQTGYVFVGQYRQSQQQDTTLRNRQKAMFFYVDEFGCMIPGCQTVDAEVQEIQQMDMMLYPNPAQDRLTIYIPNKPTYLQHKEAELHIYDLQGKLVHHQKIPTDQLHILLDVNSWMAGTYFAVLNFENQERVVKKFVVH